LKAHVEFRLLEKILFFYWQSGVYIGTINTMVEISPIKILDKDKAAHKIAMGNQQQAQRILFKLLDQNINDFWD
jgi:hypothetical protein